MFWAFPYLIFYLLMFFFWLFKQAKAVLFWVYLWQLKEYHIGRFVDHFRTAKGKSLFINKLYFTKIFLISVSLLWIYLAETLAQNFFRQPESGSTVFLFLFSPSCYYYLLYFLILSFFVVFALEGIYSLSLILRGAEKRPVWTKKTYFLSFVGFFTVALLALALFNRFLGEMALIDIALAGFCLLVFDATMPLVVSSVVLFFQPLAAFGRYRLINRAIDKRRSFKNLSVIGITGSYGKTSVKEILALILERKFKTLKTPVHRNSEAGISQTILSDLKPEHEIFVCEMAAYNRGGIKLVSSIADPKTGIISGINSQHMATYGSQEKIIRTKFELAEFLPQDGTLILNWDSILVRRGYDEFRARIKAKKTVWCSRKEGKDVWASEVKSTIDGLSFVLNCKEEKYRLDTNAKGAYMAMPILLAAAAALERGIGLEEAGQIINEIDFEPLNIKTEKGINGITVLSSTYSANPDGVLAHLEYLKLWPGKLPSEERSAALSLLKGKKAIIMPCLIELGRASKEVHFAIGKKIGEVCDLAIITTKDRFKELRSGALESGMKTENIFFSDQVQRIAETIKGNLETGDIVLFEGRLSQKITESIIKQT